MEALGHEVEIAAVNTAGNGPYLDVPVAGRQRWSPSGLRTVISACRRADLVIGFGSSALLTGAIGAAAARRPFIYRSIGDPKEWHDVRFSSVRLTAPLRSTAAIVAVFPEARAEYLRRFGFADDHVLTIPRGTPADRYPWTSASEREAARQRLGLDLRPWLAFVGSLSAEKAPHRAIEATLAHPTAGLIVCGDGPLADDVQAIAAPHADRIRVLGPLPDVLPVLRAADALLLTSTTEGVPGSVIEAGLTGLPTIASAVGGLPYIVQDNITGLLVPPTDTEGFTRAIDTVISAREQMGQAAAVKSREHFSMEVIAARWAELIEHVLQRG